MAPLVVDPVVRKPLSNGIPKPPPVSASATIYQSLRYNELRIAKLNAASTADEEICCSLITASIDNLPHYKALSYCWGKSKDTARITIDGHPVTVTTTLAAALQVLRPKEGEEPLLIWIDALCIDQTNLEERGEQVEKMQLIYERADEVAVWLGVEENSSELAWQLLNDLHDCYGDRKQIMRLFNSSRLAEFEALRVLFRREYWFRIWVVQEVTCAKEVTVYCGSQHISWSFLENACDLMTEFSKSLKENIYHDKPAHVFSLMRGGPRSLRVTTRSSTTPWSHTLPSLQELLYLHGSKLSTDASDKVNALIGISSARNSFGHVDYTRSVAATYLHTAQFIISSTQKLDIICYSQNDDNLFGLPTWVPDWQRRNLHPKHREVGLQIRTPAFKAARESVALVEFLGSGRVLKVQGFVYDVIASTSEEFYLDGPESDVLPTLRAFTSWWRTVAAAQGTEEEVQEIFQRTFCGGAWSPDYEEEESHRLPLFFGLSQRLLPGSLDWCPAVKDVHLSAHRDGQSDEVLEKRQRAMVASVGLRMHSKCIAVSSMGVTGLAPMAAEEGDVIAVLFGCAFPVVMRHFGQGSWLLLGSVYVDGIMHGEAMEAFGRGRFERKSFRIY